MYETFIDLEWIYVENNAHGTTMLKVVNKPLCFVLLYWLFLYISAVNFQSMLTYRKKCFWQLKYAFTIVISFSYLNINTNSFSIQAEVRLFCAIFHVWIINSVNSKHEIIQMHVWILTTDGHDDMKFQISFLDEIGFSIDYRKCLFMSSRWAWP